MVTEISAKLLDEFGTEKESKEKNHRKKNESEQQKGLYNA